MKKKLIIFAAILCVLAIFVIACGANQQNSQSNTNTNTETENTDTGTEGG